MYNINKMSSSQVIANLVLISTNKMTENSHPWQTNSPDWSLLKENL